MVKVPESVQVTSLPISCEVLFPIETKISLSHLQAVQFSILVLSHSTLRWDISKSSNVTKEKKWDFNGISNRVWKGKVSFLFLMLYGRAELWEIHTYTHLAGFQMFTLKQWRQPRNQLCNVSALVLKWMETQRRETRPRVCRCIGNSTSEE